MLLHSYNGTVPHPQYWVGGYAESATEDIFSTWTLQKYAEPAYTTMVQFSDGTAVNFTRRERPKLLLSPTGQPRILYNGVCVGTNQGKDCFTLAQEVGM